MNFSKLRHRITLQKEVTQPDTFGSETVTWQDVCTVWASVEPLKGREFFAAQKETAETTAKIAMRYRTGVTSELRVVYGDRTFEINAVIDVEEHHIELQLMCRELV